MLQIGITGGIGSGKSLICKVFSCLGAPVYDADTRAKWLMKNDKTLKKNIIQSFGVCSYTDHGEINRTHLAREAFSSMENTKRLNAIVHPCVASDYSRWLSNQQSSYVVKEAALLIESGTYQQLDRLVVVKAPIALRIKRIKNRDGFRSEAEIRAIIDKQLSDEQREMKADYSIDNNEQQLLIEQVLRLDRTFRAIAS